VEKVAAAVLSTTAKAKARAKEKKEKGEAMETDVKSPKPSGTAAAAAGSGDVEMKDEAPVVKAEDEKDKDKDKAASKRKEKEPSSETLQNLSRVTPAQLAHISFPHEGRFQPVRPIRSGGGKTRAGGGGILMLIDRTPGEPVKYVDLPADLGGEEAPKPAEGMQVDEPAEAPPPAPFEYPFDDS
jgi:26S proteasome regulatory subunit N2